MIYSTAKGNKKLIFKKVQPLQCLTKVMIDCLAPCAYMQFYPVTRLIILIFSILIVLKSKFF